MSSSVSIRPATLDDASIILDLLYELADFESRRSLVSASVEDLRELLSGERPFAEALLAELEGSVVGFALYYYSISSFAGKTSLYLEDLFVQAPHRRKGIGRKLLSAVAKVAYERKCLRMEWSVLNWNQGAIDLYLSLGARPLDAWSHYSLADFALQELALEH